MMAATIIPSISSSIEHSMKNVVKAFTSYLPSLPLREYPKSHTCQPFPPSWGYRIRQEGAGKASGSSIRTAGDCSALLVAPQRRGDKFCSCVGWSCLKNFDVMNLFHQPALLLVLCLPEALHRSVFKGGHDGHVFSRFLSFLPFFYFLHFHENGLYSI